MKKQEWLSLMSLILNDPYPEISKYEHLSKNINTVAQKYEAPMVRGLAANYS